MSWIGIAFKSIFGQSKLDIGNTFNTVAKGIDNLAFTDQERVDKLSEFVKDTLSENTERSKSRRFIAKFIIINVFAVFWLCVLLIFKGIDISKILELSGEFMLPTAFLMVLAFFFGSHIMRDVKKKS